MPTRKKPNKATKKRESTTKDLLPTNTHKHRTVAAERITKNLEAYRNDYAALTLTAERYVANAAILPLLAMAQAVPRTNEGVPAPNTAKDLLAMGDAALMALSRLCDVSAAMLENEGWGVVDDGTGRAVYVNEETKETRGTPPELSAREEGEDMGGMDRKLSTWVRRALLELPTMIAPQTTRLPDGSVGETLTWPANVIHLEMVSDPVPEENTEDDETTRRSRTPTSKLLAIVDVLDEGEGEGEGVEEEGGGGGGGGGSIVRQMIHGPYLGTSGFRETEWDLDHPPGAHLENWYAVTIAGLALCVAPTEDARVLTVGLGGGSIPSFLATYAPRIRQEAVEVHPAIARCAERFYGFRCSSTTTDQASVDDDASILEEFAASLPELSKVTWSPRYLARGGPDNNEGRKDEAIFEEETTTTPVVVPHDRKSICRTHVEDARRFVKSRRGGGKEREGGEGGDFDVVLLDVYTDGKFPSSLLTLEFFEDLRAILVTSKKDAVKGSEGTGRGYSAVIVNAGRGKDARRIETLLRRVFPVVRLCVDADVPVSHLPKPSRHRTPERDHDGHEEASAGDDDDDDDDDDDEDERGEGVVLVGYAVPADHTAAQTSGTFFVYPRKQKTMNDGGKNDQGEEVEEEEEMDGLREWHDRTTAIEAVNPPHTPLLPFGIDVVASSPLNPTVVRVGWGANHRLENVDGEGDEKSDGSCSVDDETRADRDRDAAAVGGAAVEDVEKEAIKTRPGGGSRRKNKNETKADGCGAVLLKKTLPADDAAWDVFG